MNGQVERYNRALLQALRAYVSKRQDDWDDFTSALTYAYNTRVHSSLGLAPLEFVLPTTIVPTSLERTPRDEPVPPASAKQEFLRRVRELRERAGGSLQRAQTRYKSTYDRDVRMLNKDVKPGDWVFLKDETPRGEHSKLESPVTGPYRVESQDGHTLRVRMGTEVVRVSSDRVCPAAYL